LVVWCGVAWCCAVVVVVQDIIVARWQEATMSNTPVPRQQSILSVYQPLPRQYWNTALTDAEVRKLTEEMLVDLEKLLPGYKTADSIAIDTHRWPGSINILVPTPRPLLPSFLRSVCL
jgi:hypothetical protein